MSVLHDAYPTPEALTGKGQKDSDRGAERCVVCGTGWRTYFGGSAPSQTEKERDGIRGGGAEMQRLYGRKSREWEGIAVGIYVYRREKEGGLGLERSVCV